MGQQQLSCYRQCKAPNNQSLPAVLTNEFEFWTNKLYSIPSMQGDESWFHDANKENYSKIVTANLKHLKKVPLEYQDYVLRLESHQKIFKDASFPHNNSSISRTLIGKPEITWKRVREILPNLQLFSNGPGLSYKLNDNVLGCAQEKLYSVFKVISEFKDVMHSLIEWPLTDNGILGVTLALNGVQSQVIIDDFVPVDAQGNYLFSTPDSLWVIFVEKALAKVGGGYQNIYKCEIPELFQEITGIPIMVSKNEPAKSNRDKQLVLMRSPSSAYKQFDRSREGLSTEEDVEDLYINLLRKPGYVLSSEQISQSKDEESFYYRFSVPKDSEVSIRVSQLLKKFVVTPGYEYSQVKIELARMQNDSPYKIVSGASNQRNTYVGRTAFLKLLAGEYFLYIRINSGASSPFPPKCSVVCYAGCRIILKSILNISKAESMKKMMMMNEFQGLRNQVGLSAQGKSLSTDFVWSDGRGLLMIYNHDPAAKRIKMRLLDDTLKFQDSKYEKETSLTVEANSKTLVSLSRIPNAPNSLFLNPGTPGYEIRVVG